MKFAITVGAGRARPQGRLMALGETSSVDLLRDALNDLPEIDDGWWSPHLFRGHYRATERWIGTWSIVLDLDYHDEHGKHAAPPTETASKLRSESRRLPGNIFHPTPRGGRLVLVLDTHIKDVELFTRAATGLAVATTGELERIGVAATIRAVGTEGRAVQRPCEGYVVDQAALLDRARFFFSPHACVDGVARVAEIHTCSGDLGHPQVVATWAVNAEVEALAREERSTRSKGGRSFEDAVAAYARDHVREWPKSGGTCPACGHRQCFGQLPRDPGRWACFSASHEADSNGCGLQGDGCWHGDVLDLDAHAAGLDRRELLQREGYFDKSRPGEVVGDADDQTWHLVGGEYRVVKWPDPSKPLFVTLEFRKDGKRIHRDNLDLDSAQARQRFAKSVMAARRSGDGFQRDLVETDLLKLIERVESAAPAPRQRDSGLGMDQASTADVLVELGQAAELFHDAQDRAYAETQVGKHRETWAVRSRRYKNWLRRQFYKKHGKVPNGQALTDALGVLEGHAQIDGDQREVHVRVAEHEGHIYLDPGRERWEVIRIGPNGWHVLYAAPVHFIRPPGLLPLPLPVRGGSLAELRPFLNLKSDFDWVLYQGCLIAGLRPNRPFPIMIINGEQGSAKTTAQRITRRLIDPNVAELRSRPRDEHDLVIALRNGWYLAYDNLSRLPRWLSDALCRVATGAGFGTRRLYTDDEEELFEGSRAVLLNGIENIATSGDLLDRAVQLYLPKIEDDDRLAEEEFWARFEEARPRILGALLDALSVALRNLPNVQLDSVPRMADFAGLGVAAEPAMDCKPGDFLAAYYANRESAFEDALEASVLAKGFREFVAGLKEPWEGTATVLLEALNHEVDDKIRRPKEWPKTASALSGTLRRLAPSLRGVGIKIEFVQQHGAVSRKLIRIWVQKSDARDASAQDASGCVGCVGDLQDKSGGPDGEDMVEGVL